VAFVAHTGKLKPHYGDTPQSWLKEPDDDEPTAREPRESQPTVERRRAARPRAGQYENNDDCARIDGADELMDERRLRPAAGSKAAEAI